MKTYLVRQKVGIFEICEPTVRDILATLFEVGRLLNWNGIKYRVQAREQDENADTFFYLSER
jgi:hypothetical protein